MKKTCYAMLLICLIFSFSACYKSIGVGSNVSISDNTVISSLEEENSNSIFSDSLSDSVSLKADSSASSIMSNTEVSITLSSSTEITPTITPKPTIKPLITSATSQIVSDNLVFSDKVLEDLIRQCLKKPKGNIADKDWEGLGYSNIYIRPSRIENMTRIQLFDPNLIKPEFSKSTSGLISNFDVLEQLTNIKFLSIIFIGEKEGASNINLDMSQICDIKNLEELSIFLTREASENISHKFELLNFNNIIKLINLKKLTINTAINVDFKIISILKNLNCLTLCDCGLADISSIYELALLEKFIVPNNNISDGDALLKLKFLKDTDLRENPVAANTQFINKLKQKFSGIRIRQ